MLYEQPPSTLHFPALLPVPPGIILGQMNPKHSIILYFSIHLQKIRVLLKSIIPIPSAHWNLNNNSCILSSISLILKRPCFSDIYVFLSIWLVKIRIHTKPTHWIYLIHRLSGLWGLSHTVSHRFCCVIVHVTLKSLISNGRSKLSIKFRTDCWLLLKYCRTVYILPSRGTLCLVSFCYFRLGYCYSDVAVIKCPISFLFGF